MLTREEKDAILEAPNLMINYSSGGEFSISLAIHGKRWPGQIVSDVRGDGEPYKGVDDVASELGYIDTLAYNNDCLKRPREVLDRIYALKEEPC